MKYLLSAFTLLMILPASISCNYTIDTLAVPWLGTQDSSSTISVTAEDNATKISYDLGDGTWVAIFNEGFNTVDLSGGDSLSFYMKGSGSSNDLQIQVKDSDGDTSSRTIDKITGNTEWNRFTVPFSSFSLWPNTGNGSLDRSKISKISFAVTSDAGGTGSIAIDDVALSSRNSVKSLLISSFDFGIPPNELGGNEAAWSEATDSDPTIEYDSQNAAEGLRCLKLEYDLSKYGGYYIMLTPEGANGTKDISSYSHLKFKTKSETAGKNFNIELWDKDSKHEVVLSTYMPAKTSVSYEEVSIALTDFAGFSSTSAVKIVFAIVQNDHPLKGIIYLDDLRFTSGDGISSKTYTTIDPMDFPCRISGWQNFGRFEDAGYTTTASSDTEGINDKAIKLIYSFNRTLSDPNDWVVLEREWFLNIEGYNSIRLKYRGKGASNNFEFKLKDSNGTIFQRKYFALTETMNIWEELIIPIKDFSYVSSGIDSNGEEIKSIDNKKIKQIDFAVSKSTGGSGVFFLKDLTAELKNNFELKRTNKLINTFAIDNNPFSPNGDGIADTSTFSFSFSDDCELKITVYDLEGREIIELDNSSRVSGVEHTVIWDGKDSGGGQLKNGMYFYKISAENGTREDSIINVIAVLR
ncbi:CIA30 family protein [Elusimicrobiota bacterium]